MPCSLGHSERHPEVTGVAEFIALDNPVAAESWVNEISDKTELLSSMPEMRRMVSELPPYKMGSAEREHDILVTIR